MSNLCRPLMKVVGQKHIEDFSRRHADARSQISSWLCEVEEAQWETPSDIKERYPHASFMADNRVVFNLKGNSYRIDTKISYNIKVVVIKRIGTHAEYNRWKF